MLCCRPGCSVDCPIWGHSSYLLAVAYPTKMGGCSSKTQPAYFGFLRRWILLYHQRFCSKSRNKFQSMVQSIFTCCRSLACPSRTRYSSIKRGTGKQAAKSTAKCRTSPTWLTWSWQPLQSDNMQLWEQLDVVFSWCQTWRRWSVLAVANYTLPHSRKCIACNLKLVCQ